MVDTTVDISVTTTEEPAQSTETTPGVTTIPTTLQTPPVDTSARFRGGGTSFRAKLIGVDDVLESRGDQMCQESILKLKAIVKASGQHKQKVVINITLDGLKIIDLMTATVLYQHAVDKISFIARDQTDRRAFGYVLGIGGGKHQFYGIKTAKIAEHTVLALRDLFQVVYEMKKQEIVEAKKNAEVNTSSAPVYSVPNNKSANPAQEGSILVLEEQLENMQQMSDMEAFKTTWSENMPTSPDTPATPGDGLNMFGTTETTVNAANIQQASYSDDLAGFDTEALEPAAGGGAKLTKDQILAGFGTGAQQQQQQSPFFGGFQQQQFGAPQQSAPFGAPQPSAAFGAPQQPGFGAAPAGNPFAGTQSMGMFPPGPRPVVPARTGAMRPPTAIPAQGGAPQNPFGDAFGDTSSGSNALLAPIDSQPKLANGAQGKETKPKDPFASLIPGMGAGTNDKKDMFKNFQMAKPQAFAAKAVGNDGGGVSSNFDDYFRKSVGGVPLDTSTTTQQAPVPAPRSNSQDMLGLASSNPAQAAVNDPFAALGGSGFDQNFGAGTQQSSGNAQQSLFG